MIPCQYTEVVEADVVTVHFPCPMSDYSPTIEVTLLWGRTREASYSSMILARTRMHPDLMKTAFSRYDYRPLSS